MPRRTEGFSLIEAVVVIAIMAILAGAAVPLLVKSLDQQRVATTQGNLQTAWQAMFGSQSSRVYNMRADFGFNPPTLPNATLNDLGKMMSSTAAFTPNPPVWPNGGAPFPNGWNGPYWNGPVVAVGAGAAAYNAPVDGWGRKIQLTYYAAAPGPGWQLHSAGPDGVMGNADDVVYPSVPVMVTTGYMASVYVSVYSARPSETTAGGTLLCQDREKGVVNIAGNTLTSNTVLPLSSVFPAINPIPVYPGPVYIKIHFDAIPGPTPYNALDFSETVDLLPGQTLSIPLVLN